MRSHVTELKVLAPGRTAFLDLTEAVEAVVAEASVRGGRVTVLAEDEGCALVINEKETGLVADVQAALDRISPSEGSTPRIGNESVVLPVVDGRIHLGQWQRILMIELDPPRPRLVSVQVMGD
jgi:secondary thiamine-phosphate synthase enzyme